MGNPVPGQILLGQFKVEAFIDSGGMGAVFRVRDLKRNVPLALKTLHSELAEDASIFKRFRREALALGVRGWVRNRLDGSVEAVAEGAAGAVDRFVDWCRTGPRGARVTGVEAVDEPDAGGFEAFEIVP